MIAYWTAKDAWPDVTRYIMLYHIWSMHVMELLIWLSKRVPYLLKVNILS